MANIYSIADLTADAFEEWLDIVEKTTGPLDAIPTLFDCYDYAEHCFEAGMTPAEFAQDDVIRTSK